MSVKQLHSLRVPAAAALAAALAVTGCTGQQTGTASPSVSADPTSGSGDRDEGTPRATPVEETPPKPPESSETPADTPPTAVATGPAEAPATTGDTKVYTFGDIEIRLTPNDLGVYTAIHVPNPSDKPFSFSVSVRVTGPAGFEVLMKRDFRHVLPGDAGREAGLLIDKDEAPAPDDPTAEIVSFEQTPS